MAKKLGQFWYVTSKETGGVLLAISAKKVSRNKARYMYAKAYDLSYTETRTQKAVKK